MTLDGGWVELLPVGRGQAIGRAHLFLHDIPARHESWRGHLDSMHPAAGVAEVPPGRYILRFANGKQNIPADVDLSDGRLTVQGDHDDVPASLAELSEGE